MKSIKSKLIVSFSAMAALILLLEGLLIISFFSMRTKYADGERQRRLLNTAVGLTESLNRQKSAVQGAVAGSEQNKNRIYVLESEISQYLGQWRKAAFSPSEMEEHKSMETRVLSLESEIARALNLLRESRRDEAGKVVSGSVIPRMEETEKELKWLVSRKKIQSEQAWESASRLVSRNAWFSLWFFISVILVGAGLVVLIDQSLTRSFLKLREGTRKVAKGELDLDLDMREPIELAEVARSFEEMAKSLAGLQMQVIKMDRMSAVGTLAGGVAHEINNPLTGVLGQAQLLLEDMAPDHPYRSSVEKIERAAKRCGKVVRGLLDFSRPQNYFFRPLDVDEAIEATLSMCQTEMTVLGIRVSWEKNPLLPRVWASDNHLRQVFLNLMTNAMQAMPEGGHFSIRTGELKRGGGGNAGFSEIAPAREDHPDLFKTKGNPLDWIHHYVEVSFTDQGSGIDPRHLQHLSDPFFTTKNPGQGTGLGLTISYGILQRHHGELEARSEGLGHGASFIVRIPVAPVEFDGLNIRPEDLRNMERPS